MTALPAFSPPCVRGVSRGLRRGPPSLFGPRRGPAGVLGRAAWAEASLVLLRVKVGGPDGSRTRDLVNAIHARSQLRHWPNRFHSMSPAAVQATLPGRMGWRSDM